MPDFSPLPREEYVEQQHFFRTLALRLKDNLPAQEALEALREEALATTKLPMAVDFLLAELRHQGSMARAMVRLGHYFSPFQHFVMQEAENDRRRFDIYIALEILQREAEYRAAGVTRQGLFLYQLEAISRNRLGYDAGLDAIGRDPSFDQAWQSWITTVNRQMGIVELSDMIYVRSEYYHQQRAQSRQATYEESVAQAQAQGAPLLFGVREGRIAWANRRKDPLLLFAALNRQLGYPEAPRPSQAASVQELLPSLARRVEQLESRLKLLEEEQRGGIELERFYGPDSGGSR
ncbi:MAG: hypothetical protein KDA61_10345 [Planctomycetales bacterium]|nr:hypothetical protein [Planctomycetales bacterium]